MTDRELMQQAQDALEYASDETKPKGLYGCECLICKTILALRDRLAQPEQEPVAWLHTKIEGVVVPHRPSDLNKHPDRWTALYPAPQPCPTCESLARTVMLDQTSHDTKRPWVGLTDNEIKEIIGPWGDTPIKGYTRKLFDQIEAKLKEKNT